MLGKARIAFFLLAGIAVIFAPLFFYIPLILSLIRFRAYEMLFLAMYADLLWYPGLPQLPLFTLSSLALLALFEPLRRRFL